MNIFLERYKELGETIDLEDFSIPKAIRINTLKMKPAALLKRMQKEGVFLEKIPYLDYGYELLASDFSLGASTEHLMGYYYIQEAAAQVPVQVLNPKKGEIILDMSAAPGGKTTQIAQYLENEGTIVAIDNNNMRLSSLRNNLERMGVYDVIIYQKDAQYVSDLGILFDKILLDAPCSGNFCIDKEWFNKRNLENLKGVSKLQKQLFTAAVDVLKVGGELVYSTCSLEPEEDEQVVDWAIETFPELEIQKIDIPIGDAGLTAPFGKKLNPKVKYAKRFWPHKTKTQGFFIAKFKKVK